MGVEGNGYHRGKFNGNEYVGSVIDLGLGNEVTLYHELGHVIYNKYLEAYGHDWENSNELGQKYLELRGYTITKLDELSQSNLAWEERASEWFAEDVKQFLVERIKQYEEPQPITMKQFMEIYGRLGNGRTDETDKILEELIFN